MTDTTENITLMQLSRRAVKITNCTHVEYWQLSGEFFQSLLILSAHVRQTTGHDSPLIMTLARRSLLPFCTYFYLHHFLCTSVVLLKHKPTLCYLHQTKHMKGLDARNILILNQTASVLTFEMCRLSSCCFFGITIMACFQFSNFNTTETVKVHDTISLVISPRTTFSVHLRYFHVLFLQYSIIITWLSEVDLRHCRRK